MIVDTARLILGVEDEVEDQALQRCYVRRRDVRLDNGRGVIVRHEVLPQAASSGRCRN